MTTKTSRTGIALLASAAIATSAPLAAPEPANAGTYDVYACEAAHDRSNHQWGGMGTYPGYRGQCDTPPDQNQTARGLITRIVPGEGGKPSSFPNGTWSGLYLGAPPGTTIAGITWSGRVVAGDWTQWRGGLQASSGHYLIGGDGCNPFACIYPATPPPAPTYFAAPPGTTWLRQFVQCRVASCTTGASVNTHWSQVRLSDNVGPRADIGGFASDQWVNGAVNTAFGAGDPAGGGIRHVILLVDDQVRADTPYTQGCDYTRLVPCPMGRSGALSTGEMAEGRRKVDVVVFDAGGNPAHATRYLRVDKTRPRQVAVAVEGGEGWRRTNGYNARWTPIADGGAPVVGASYELCKPGRRECSPPKALSATDKLEDLQVPGDGIWELRVALRDEAGNVADFADARPATLRLDTQPPELSLAAQDPADPLRIQAPASDGLSGVAAGQIEIRRQGTTTWEELPTTVRGGALEATLDDERRPDGKYDLRAVAVDAAGNSAATGILAGARALPVRIKTTLRAKMARTVRKRGRKRVKLTASRRVRYGRKYQIRGRLVTAEGQPLEQTPVNVYAKADQLGTGFRAVGVVSTDRNGRFRYRAKARQSRIMRLRYEGTRRVRASEAEVHLKVPARVSLAVRPRAVLNGEYARFRGRVKGPIPPGGKLVALQAYTGGRWGTFQTARTNLKGRYTVLRRFVGTRGSVRYRIRAVATRETLFPYHSGFSRPIRLRVRGL